jgi:hypothetical protein
MDIPVYVCVCALLFAHSFELTLTWQGNISTKLEDFEAANKAYCASLMLHEEYVGAWEGWGELCQRVSTREANPEQHAQWATAAMVCLLQALRSHSEDEPQRRLATRTLLLLALEPDLVGPTFQAFSDHIDPMCAASQDLLCLNVVFFVSHSLRAFISQTGFWNRTLARSPFAGFGGPGSRRCCRPCRARMAVTSA